MARPRHVPLPFLLFRDAGSAVTGGTLTGDSGFELDQGQFSGSRCRLSGSQQTAWLRYFGCYTHHKFSCWKLQHPGWDLQCV